MLGRDRWRDQGAPWTSLVWTVLLVLLDPATHVEQLQKTMIDTNHLASRRHQTGEENSRGVIER